eukprot:CAMPEP_0114975462 /NCGR_PEP_ID=MMETSP0216-20121206/2111_1 /TAXON_ID=223996 /ORGANISM="Protocruzia adherens, Strain Boccale" /LENGTH=47 /DNA_ID= /DNA_START= /DNA_END= /DNA_ORIENTATION=
MTSGWSRSMREVGKRDECRDELVQITKIVSLLCCAAKSKPSTERAVD